MKLDQVCSSVLKKIRPSREERKKTHRLCFRIMKIARKNAKPYGSEPQWCGSIEKGTWLAGDKDLDLFLLFKGISRGKLEDYGLRIGKAISRDLEAKRSVAYAEHPYSRVTVNDHELEIVPAYRVKPHEIKSAVDRTPHHVRWIKANLREELKPYVLLLKQFCKASKIYGSDLKTRGFGGYLCELLIASYGTFRRLLSKVSESYPPIVLNPGKYPIDKEKLKEEFEGDVL